jgi:hypothetical protein
MHAIAKILVLKVNYARDRKNYSFISITAYQTKDRLKIPPPASILTLPALLIEIIFGLPRDKF